MLLDLIENKIIKMSFNNNCCQFCSTIKMLGLLKGTRNQKRQTHLRDNLVSCQRAHPCLIIEESFLLPALLSSKLFQQFDNVTLLQTDETLSI